jgi:Arc/MetJ family transcription regulator
MADITSIRVTKDVHTELMKIIGQIQAKTGKPTTIDDALKELVENYKKKSK